MGFVDRHGAKGVAQEGQTLGRDLSAETVMVCAEFLYTWAYLLTLYCAILGRVSTLFPRSKSLIKQTAVTLMSSGDFGKELVISSRRGWLVALCEQGRYWANFLMTCLTDHDTTPSRACDCVPIFTTIVDPRATSLYHIQPQLLCQPCIRRELGAVQVSRKVFDSASDCTVTTGGGARWDIHFCSEPSTTGILIVTSICVANKVLSFITRTSRPYFGATVHVR